MQYRAAAFSPDLKEELSWRTSKIPTDRGKANRGKAKRARGMVRTVSLDNGDRASSSQVRTGKRINKTRPGDSRAHPRMTTKDNADNRRVSGAADETPKVAKTSGSARHSFRAPAQLGEGRGLGSGSRVLLALQTFESSERRAGSRRKD